MNDDMRRRLSTARRRAMAMRVIAAVLCGTAITGVPVPPAGAQVGRDVRTFDIPSLPLPRALRLLADQAGIQVAYETALAAETVAPAVRGAMTVEQALARLLSGSTLRYSFTTANTVTILAGGAVAPTGSTPVLDPVTVQGRVERADGPVQGIVAQRTVTGAKTDMPITAIPQSVSVVTADQVRRMGVQSVSEALRYTPGVDAEAYGFDARFNHFTVRGFQFDKFQFVDGLRFPAGAYAIPRIEPYGLERIEMLRGPASVLYGQNVPGGMVNLVSKQPTEERVREVQIGTGYPARIQGAFDVGGAANADKTVLFRLVGLASYGDTQVDRTTDRRTFLAPSLTYKPTEDTRITILSHIQKDNVEGWSGTFLPMQGTLLRNPNGRIPVKTFVGEPGYDHYKRDQYAIAYDVEHRFSDALSVRSSTRYASVNVDAPNLYPSALDPVDLRTLSRSMLRFRDYVRNVTTDNNLRARFDVGPMQHTVVAGIDYQWLRDRDRFDVADGPTPSIDIFNPVRGAPLPGLKRLFDSDIRQTQLGIYVQDQIRWDNWLLTLGGRQDWARSRTTNKVVPGPDTKTKDNAFTGRAGLTYLFDIGLALYGSYSTSFEPLAGTTYEGKPFVPTTGRQYEVGVKYQPPGSQVLVTAAVYQLTQRNVRTADTRSDAPPFSEIQEGEIRVRGVEIEAKASIWRGWDVVGFYTFADAVTTRSATVEDGIAVQGKHAPSVPRHQVGLWAKYTFADGALEGLGLGAGVRYRGSLYADNINRFKIPAVTLVDAVLSYDLGSKLPRLAGVTLNINASNVLGKRYVANCSAGVCYYGLGRAVTATLAYRW